jgi:hypothetical protein
MGFCSAISGVEYISRIVGYEADTVFGERNDRSPCSVSTTCASSFCVRPSSLTRVGQGFGGIHKATCGPVKV